MRSVFLLLKNRSRLCGLLLGLILLFAALTQSFAEQETPPVSQINDTAQVLDSEREAALSKQLSNTNKRYHIPIYFLSAPMPPEDALAGNWAADTCRAWIPDGLGAVMVYSQENKHVSIGMTKAFREMRGEINTLGIIQNAESAIQQGTPEGIAIREAILQLDYELRKVYKAQAARNDLLKKATYIGFSLSVLIFIYLIFWTIHRLRHHNFFGKAFLFPAANIPPRLGGSFTGGLSAVLKTKSSIPNSKYSEKKNNA